MDSAVMLAKVFGPFLAIIGLWMLLYGDNLVKIMTTMKNSPPSVYLAAIVTLLIGLFMINTYNSWSMDIYFFVTLLGWAMFLRGVLGFFLPQVLVLLFMKNTAWIKVMGIFPFVWGLILIWAGFYR